MRLFRFLAEVVGAWRRSAAPKDDLNTSKEPRGRRRPKRVREARQSQLGVDGVALNEVDQKPGSRPGVAWTVAGATLAGFDQALRDTATQPPIVVRRADRSAGRAGSNNPVLPTKAGSVVAPPSGPASGAPVRPSSSPLRTAAFLTGGATGAAAVSGRAAQVLPKTIVTRTLFKANPKLDLPPAFMPTPIANVAPLPTLSVANRDLTRLMRDLSRTSEISAPVLATKAFVADGTSQVAATGVADNKVLKAVNNSLQQTTSGYENRIANLEARINSKAERLPEADRTHIEQFFKAQSEYRAGESARLKCQLADSQSQLSQEQVGRVNDRAQLLESNTERLVLTRRLRRELRDEERDPFVRIVFQAMVLLGSGCRHPPGFGPTGSRPSAHRPLSQRAPKSRAEHVQK